jgi:hypothetical protein
MKTKGMQVTKGKKKNPFADKVKHGESKLPEAIKPGLAVGKPRKVGQGIKGTSEDRVGGAEQSGHKGSSRSKGVGMKKKRVVK